MIIECIIEREGPTHVGINGFQYKFDANEHGHKVCAVNSREHQAWLLKFPKYYREYQAPDAEPEILPESLPESLPEQGRTPNGRFQPKARKR